MLKVQSKWYKLLGVLVVGGLAAVLAHSAAAGRPAAQPPNVLLIMLDDVATEYAAYGGPVYAPTFDALAAAGTVFTNATVDSTLCNPSRVSLLTGLYPPATCITTVLGVNNNGTDVRDWRNYANECPTFQARFPGRDAFAIESLIGRFHDSGYHTLATGKVWHNIAQQDAESADIDAGRWQITRVMFDSLLANKPLSGLPVDFGMLDWGAVEAGRDVAGNPLPESTLKDYIAADDFIRELERAPADRPLFAAIGFRGSHYPQYAPQRLIDLYDDVPLPAVDFEQWRTLPPDNFLIRAHLDYIISQPAVWRSFMQTYLATISYTDEQIGRVWQAWQAGGRDLSNTIVIIWSDHGYSYGRHLNLEKGNLWREQTHIPLLLAGVGVPAGLHVPTLVNSVDIYPTLVELAGIAPPADGFARDGRSLRPLLAGERWPDAAAVSCVHNGCMIETPDAIFVRWRMSQPLTQVYELYDLTDDPLQFNNRAALPESAVQIAKLRARLYGELGLPDITRNNLYLPALPRR